MPFLNLFGATSSLQDCHCISQGIFADGRVPFSSPSPCGDHSALWNILLAVPSGFPALHLILLQFFG